MAAPLPARKRGLLETLGLHRPQLRAWAMYDWAISSMQTVIIAAVFPVFYLKVAAAGMPESEGLASYGYASTVAAVLIAILAPILGAVADFKAAKKRFLLGFMLLGVTATACMFFISEGQWMLAALLLVLSIAGATGSMTFYEALLPHIASDSEMDRVSTAAYGFGYLGGGLLLAFNLLWILNPAAFGLPSGDGLSSDQQSLPTRIAFVSVGVWWLLFSIPLFRSVPEPPRAIEADEHSTENPLRVALQRLGETVRDMRGYKQAFLAMLAFTIYNDGIQTIIKMAVAFGTDIGLETSSLITAILLVQFIGVPFAFAFGQLARVLGTKGSIMVGLVVYTGICIFAYGISTEREFYILACLVGLVQGGTQALSRSLFANMVPKHKSGEFFGFYSVFEKFGGILGPLLFAVATGEAGSRVAILWVIGFFVVGGAILMTVNIKEGERVARDADALMRARTAAA